MKIYVIRHGQTTGDVEDRYGGAYDDELSDKGKEQVRELAEKLADSGIEILYCSPLIRTQQTAKVLKEKLGCEVKTINDLRERNKNGILSGMTKAEAMEKYPHLVEELKDYRNQIEGAEAQDDFAKRIKKAFWEAIGDERFSTIGIVTHGGPIWALFWDILEDSRLEGIDDCAYVVLEKTSQKLSIVGMEGVSYKADKC